MNTVTSTSSFLRPAVVRGRVCVVAVLLLLMARPSLTVAQSVTATVAGIVVDARTRQPLVGGLVALGRPPQSMPTDTEGRFRFEAVPVGAQELVVSLVGFALEKQTVVIGPEGLDMTVTLTEGAAAFSERVTVRGSVFGSHELGVAGQQSLSSGELRQLGGMTLDDPLRAVQALSGASASDDFSGELAVRGSGFRDLNYTLDDAPARFLLHTMKLYEDGGSVTMINSDVLDHASLLRGAYPQRFDQRVGAALAFTSSDGSRERPRYNLTASGTSASATADGPLGGGRGSWLASGRRSYLDLFLKRILNDSSLAFGFGDLFSKVVYDLSDHHQLQATLVAGRSRFEAAAVQNPSRDLGSASHTGWLATGAWRHTTSRRVTLTHRFFLTGESYDNRNGLDDRAATGRSTDAGYRMDAAYTAGPTRVVEAGWSLERLGTRAQHAFRIPGWSILGGEDFDARAMKVGAYGQVHWGAGRVTVTPGARVDRFDLVGEWVASPWLQVEVRAAPTLTVLVNVGLHHQWPEFEQVVGRRGTAVLEPARALHVDAGLEGRLGANSRWQLTVYTRDERNVVDPP